MKRSIQRNKGVTLMELLVVVAIIGILVLVGTPNIIQIIRMNRLRVASNDLYYKTRFIRNLAIKSRRQLQLVFKPQTQSFYLQRVTHREYDLLQDIATAVSKGETLGDRYLLYEEEGGSVCVSTWDDARVSEDSCEYYVGRRSDNNGVDTMATTCPSNTLLFQPSGVVDDTCEFTLKNDRLNREYEIKVYKGGQIRMKRTLG